MGSLDDDTLFFFNYRSDRMREIASVFGLPDKPMEVDVPKNLVRLHYSLEFYTTSRLTSDAIGQHITTMSRYNAEFPFPVAFPPQAMTNVLAEWLAKKGVKQAHIAGKFILSLIGFAASDPPSNLRMMADYSTFHRD